MAPISRSIVKRTWRSFEFIARKPTEGLSGRNEARVGMQSNR